MARTQQLTCIPALTLCIVMIHVGWVRTVLNAMFLPVHNVIRRANGRRVRRLLLEPHCRKMVRQ